jgi:hypothetical protein
LVTVLSILGKNVTVTDTLPMGDVVNAVAITPDGRHALATKLLAHKVAQLSISPEGKLTDDKQDLPVGALPLEHRDHAGRQARACEQLRDPSPNYSVRPNGAVHQWRKDPPRQLLVGPGS